MNVRQEYDRLKEAFRKKDQRKQNFLIATVADASPHITYGYVIATLSDATPVVVQCWTSDQLVNGQAIWIAPISGLVTGSSVNWYLLIGVNSSTDLATTPFTPPVAQSGSLPSHALDGVSHTGLLPWSKIDTSITKVDLTSAVTGNLPTSHQSKQTSLQTLTITTGSLAASGSETLSITGPNIAYVRNMSITGGTNCTFTMYEDASSTVQYGTTSVSTPFEDDGGWMFVDTTNLGLWRYYITNDSGSSAVFTITLKIIAWES